MITLHKVPISWLHVLIPSRDSTVGIFILNKYVDRTPFKSDDNVSIKHWKPAVCSNGRADGRRVCLPHWSRVAHVCVIKIDHQWSVPSHYLNQCLFIVNWNRQNKFQWNSNLNSYIFIEENAYENVVWKKAAILSRPQCVNSRPLSWVPGHQSP